MIDNPGVCTQCVLRIRTRPAFWEAETLRATAQDELDTSRAEADTLRSQNEMQNDELAAIQWAINHN